MVRAWRSLWYNNTEGATEAEFSFGWAQLNSFGAPDGPRGHPDRPTSPLRNGSEDALGVWTPGFPSIRWAQTQSLAAIPNSFQAVILDTPSPSGAIHSCFKQIVGSRLARGALATAYGRTDLQHGSSAFISGARQSGRELHVTIANASSLVVRASLGFEVLAAQGPSPRMWQSAPIVRTDGGSTLVLSLANVSAAPTALRYLWSTTPCSADRLACPVYHPVPKLGRLTGESDTLPLGPAALALQ